MSKHPTIYITYKSSLFLRSRSFLLLQVRSPKVHTPKDSIPDLKHFALNFESRCFASPKTSHLYSSALGNSTYRRYFSKCHPRQNIPPARLAPADANPPISLGLILHQHSSERAKLLIPTSARSSILPRRLNDLAQPHTPLPHSATLAPANMADLPHHRQLAHRHH